MCRQCGGEKVRAHCAGFTCGWVVCDKCSATSDATRTEPWFFVKKPRAKRS